MSKLAQLVVAGIFAFTCAATAGLMAQSLHYVSGSGDDWPYYGHDAGGMRFSPLAQINCENVATLRVASTFHVGDISDGSGGRKRSGLETTPILVDGILYLTAGFNRDTGAPVFPLEERPVPQTDVPGEVTSPTQPFPLAPPAVASQKLSVDDAWGITPEDLDVCRERLKSLRNDGLFTAPSLQGSLSIPGNVGGMNWSGYAYDAQHSLLVVNTNNLRAKMRVIPAEKYWDEVDQNAEDGEYTQQSGAPYGIFRTFLFAKAHHLPCAPPPWGMLTAVDMASGTIRWQVPLGSLAPPKPMVPLGAPSLGGPIVTAGGLVFIAGTMIDPSLRAFDVETGKEIWKTQLPTSGGATPVTYQTRKSGKQFLVIAAGGHRGVTEEPQNDSIVSFTLP